jgi:hypothetical protein
MDLLIEKLFPKVLIKDVWELKYDTSNPSSKVRYIYRTKGEVFVDIESKLSQLIDREVRMEYNHKFEIYSIPDIIRYIKHIINEESAKEKNFWQKFQFIKCDKGNYSIETCNKGNFTYVHSGCEMSIYIERIYIQN